MDSGKNCFNTLSACVSSSVPRTIILCRYDESDHDPKLNLPDHNKEAF